MYIDGFGESWLGPPSQKGNVGMEFEERMGGRVKNVLHT